MSILAKTFFDIKPYFHALIGPKKARQNLLSLLRSGLFWYWVAFRISWYRGTLFCIDFDNHLSPCSASIHWLFENLLGLRDQ